jgi:Amt family ammonium transporter
MAFQATFCIITAALISGAIVERMRFSAYVMFITLWALVVYAPIAHWVWGGGWLAKMGALDFAGGTVVHVNAQWPHSWPPSSSASGRSTRRRRCCRITCRSCCSGRCAVVRLVRVQRGSAVASNGIAGLAFVTTMLAPAATLVMWTFLDAFRSGKPTAVGAADRDRRWTRPPSRRPPVSSARWAQSRLAAIAAFPCYIGLVIRAKTSLDDSLDVVAAHGLGGTDRRAPHGRVCGQKSQWRGRRAPLRHPGQLRSRRPPLPRPSFTAAYASFILLKIIGAINPCAPRPQER